MIASLSGILLVKDPARIVIDVNGVGYDVQISSRTYDRLPGVGDEIFVHVHTSVREDAITLYGFSESGDREMFLLLNTVSGIGPKLALAILSGISPSGLCEAISLKNISRLTALSGVGKKTAERMCMELKDKAGSFAAPESDLEPGGGGEAMEGTGAVRDALSALVNLGYSEAMAWQALQGVRKHHAESFGAMKVEELIREALRSLN